MKRIAVVLVVLVAALGCTQKPAPVASDTAPTDPADRLAIAVEYAAIPSMPVYARPEANAPVIATYGFREAISVLERQGDWSMVRTFDGTGWAKNIDLMNAEKGAALDPLVPRFYQAPETVPFRGHGQLDLQAKVNTDGEVVEVKVVKNTTGSQAIADANAEALKAAKFYPMVDQGSRKTFIYEHRVFY